MVAYADNLFANEFTQPQALAPVGRWGGRLRTIQDRIQTTAAQRALNEVVILAKLPSAAVIDEIKIAAEDLETGGAPSLSSNVGLFNRQGGTVFTGSNLMFAAGNTTLFRAPILFDGSGGITSGAEFRYAGGTWIDTAAEQIQSLGTRLWELVNLFAASTYAVDPGGHFYLGYQTAVAANVSPALAYMGCRIRYALD